MMKKRNKIVAFMLAFALAAISMNYNFTTLVQAATGLNMNGTTIKGYAYSNSNFSVYDRTDNYKRKIGTCYGSSDLITISGVGSDGWSKITYPAGRTYKTGYCQSSYLFQNTNFDGNAGRVNQNITTYTKSNCSYRYGTTTTGDNVFIVGYANGNTQILYPCSGYYKVAWIKGKYVVSGGNLSKPTVAHNPQGWFDSATSNSSNKLTVSGWSFDRDNLNSKIAIHIYVGGPCGSGAPGYAITANTYRPDVNRAYPGVGNYHGFSSTITVNRTGNQTIYVYAINVGGGNNVLLGTKTVNIKGSTTNSTKLSYGLYQKTSAYISCGFDGYRNTAGRHEGIDIQGGNGSAIYSLTDGEVVRVAYGYRGSSGLSTIAIYDSSTNKTVVYLHSAPVSLRAGQRISKGQKIGTQDWRGCSSSSGGHTHVEVVNGRSGYAKKSVNDYNLENQNPTFYWNSKGYTIN